MSTEDRAGTHRTGVPGAPDHAGRGERPGLLGTARRTPRARTTARTRGRRTGGRRRPHRGQRRSTAASRSGSAFFGWLTAIGTAVVLTAVLALAATAFGVTTGTTLEDVTDQVREDPGAGALASALVGALVLGASFWCGGYAAGRMARFDGTRQGLAVWLWALLVAVARGRPRGRGGRGVRRPRRARRRCRACRRSPAISSLGLLAGVAVAAIVAGRVAARRARGHALPPHRRPVTGRLLTLDTGTTTEEDCPVEIDKQEIIEALRGRGEDDLADRVDAELPRRSTPRTIAPSSTRWASTPPT